MRLVIDDRYGGRHGIGRYATEILARLRQPWVSLEASGTPTALQDVINPKRRSLGATDLLYSPGYAVGLSPALQVPTIHDLIHIRQPRRGRGFAHRAYYDRVVKPIIRKNGHVITVSKTTADDIRDWLDDDSVLVHHSGNGCSDVFVANGSSYESERPYALFVGNFKPHKNPEVLFAAVGELSGIDLVVVSGDTDQAQALAAKHGIANRITVLSSLTDPALAAVYRGAAVLVFPSVMEGFGLPVVEALRCGTPVVYYRGCGSVAEICARTQFPVEDARDTSEFATAIRSAISSPFNPPPLDAYTWDQVAASVDMILTSIAGGAR